MYQVTGAQTWANYYYLIFNIAIIEFPLVVHVIYFKGLFHEQPRVITLISIEERAARVKSGNKEDRSYCP